MQISLVERSSFDVSLQVILELKQTFENEIYLR